MGEHEHSEAFLLVRQALLALGEADRRRLGGLYGALTAPLPDPSLELRAIIRAIAALDDADHIRLARWIRRYVNRWGQIPVAASRSVVPAARTVPARSAADP